MRCLHFIPGFLNLVNPNEVMLMSKPRSPTLFEGINDLNLDCSNEILTHLNAFHRMTLSQTNNNFRQLVGNFNKNKTIAKIINNIKGLKLFDNLLTLPANMNFATELLATSEMILKKLNFYSSKFYTTQGECLDLIDWLNSTEVMQSNSHALWSIGFATALRSLRLRALPHKLIVTDQNLYFMKEMARAMQKVGWVEVNPPIPNQVKVARGGSLFSLVGNLIQLLEVASEENKEIRECIIEKLYFRFYCVNGHGLFVRNDRRADEKTRSAFEGMADRFRAYAWEKKNGCIVFSGNEPNAPYSDFYHDNAEFFRENELPSDPGNFVTNSGTLIINKMWPHSKWLLAGKVLMAVADLFNDKWVLKEFASLLKANFLTLHAVDQVERLKVLIQTSHVDMNVIHKCFLILHLTYNNFNFEKYKEVYRIYIESLTKLNNNPNLHEKIINVFKDFFNESYWENHPEFRQHFLNTIVQKCPWSEDFWNAVYDASLYNEESDETSDSDEKEDESFEIRQKKQFVSFSVAMFDEGKNYNDRKTLHSLSVVFAFIYHNVPNIEMHHDTFFDACSVRRGAYRQAINTGRVGSFADFRQLLSIKLVGKLWIRKNKNWFDSHRSPISHCFRVNENEHTANYEHFFVTLLETISLYPSAPIRLNQVMAFEDYLLGPSANINAFNSRLYLVFIALLRLPNNLFEIALGKLEKLRTEKADIEDELAFLQPFIKLFDSDYYFVKAERGALLPFYDFLGRLNKEALSNVLSDLASKSILSIMLEHYVTISDYNSRLSGLYLRLVELIFTSTPKPIDEFKLLVALGERCNGFNPATPTTRWLADTSNTSLIYYEFTKQIEEILSSSAVCKRSFEAKLG